MAEIIRYRGDTYADEITIKSKVTKKPIDITGYSFTLTVDSKQNPTDETTKKYFISGVIVDALAGRVEFVPTEEQANLSGQFYYDIQMIDTLGRKRTITSDKYTYKQDITKS